MRTVFVTDNSQREFGTKGGRGRVGVASVWRSLPLSLLFLLCAPTDSFAQHRDKPRPEAWGGLVLGGRFMDRILPAPIHQGLENDTWGADAVRPRDIHNGIENPDWSYWGVILGQVLHDTRHREDHSHRISGGAPFPRIAGCRTSPYTRLLQA